MRRGLIVKILVVLVVLYLLRGAVSGYSGGLGNQCTGCGGCPGCVKQAWESAARGLVYSDINPWKTVDNKVAYY
jgi:hypothetical protein